MKPSINDICKFVNQGRAQKPENCKILIREIEHLRKENKMLIESIDILNRKIYELESLNAG